MAKTCRIKRGKTKARSYRMCLCGGKIAKLSRCGLKKKGTKKSTTKKGRKCKFGVNKVTKKCLKHPRTRK